MKFVEALEKLQTSQEYAQWRKDNPTGYLSHGFIMVDPKVKEEWQVGFYIPEREAVVTFSVGDKILINPETEALKQEGHIMKLDVNNVKTTLQDALSAADKVQMEKYRTHTPMKKIVILQKLDLGQVWNITYVTNTFKTLNIKIDSLSGDVLKDELIDLFRIEK